LGDGGASPMMSCMRLPGRPESVRVTPVGWVLIVLLPALVVLGFVGPSGLQAIAFAVCALIALVVVATASGIGQPRDAAFRRLYLDEAEPEPAPQVLDGVDDPDAWQRERERREGRGREPAPERPDIGL
jgi:hypothetical protein